MLQRRSREPKPGSGREFVSGQEKSFPAKDLGTQNSLTRDEPKLSACLWPTQVEATAEVEAVMKVVDSLAKYIARREFASIEGKGVTLSEVGPIECLAVHGEAP